MRASCSTSSTAIRLPRARPTAASPTATEAIDALEMAASFSGEFDSHNAIVSIFAGAGGVDAADWAAMLDAHVSALGRIEGILDADRRRVAGRRGGSEIGNVFRARAQRVRHAGERARRASSGSPLAVRRGAPAAHVVCRRRRDSRGRRRREPWTSRSSPTTCASRRSSPAAPAASTLTRPNRRCA